MLSKIARFWLPVIFWAALIFTFSSEALPSTSEFYWKDFIIKKTAHLIEYSIFALLLYRAFINSGVKRGRAVLYTIVIAIAYGAADEFHQSFTPGRQPRLRDLGFDTIGAGFATYYLWKLLPKAPKKLRDWAAKLQLN